MKHRETIVSTVIYVLTGLAAIPLVLSIYVLIAGKTAIDTIDKHREKIDEIDYTPIA